MRQPLRILYSLAFAAVLVLWQASAAAHEMHHGNALGSRCSGLSLSCATTATPTFGPDGRLWLVWSAGGFVSVAQSTDHGRTFTAPVALNRYPAEIDNGPDARPKIAVDGHDHVVVAYTVFRGRYNGEIFTARSVDGGASFGPPQPLSASPASQRFPALSFGPAGRLLIAWLDKREVAAARKTGEDYAGAALASAWSTDAGARFTPARIAQSDTCECCRLGLAFAGPGRPVVAWRNIFAGSIRDHAVTTLEFPAGHGPIHRVSADNWKIEACPHHGPDVAVSADGTYHVAWFTGGSVRQGLFYARSIDGGKTFSAPMALGHSDRLPSRPQVLAVGDTVWLAWKEFDGQRTTIPVMVSRDGGIDWSEPRVAAETTDASDHPLLVSDGRHAFLSWLTHNEGYRLLPLEDMQ